MQYKECRQLTNIQLNSHIDLNMQIFQIDVKVKSDKRNIANNYQAKIVIITLSKLE